MMILTSDLIKKFVCRRTRNFDHTLTKSDENKFETKRKKKKKKKVYRVVLNEM